MRKWIVLALVGAALGLVGFAHWRTIRYDSLILKYSEQYKLDFHLVKAVIHEESRFDSSTRGKKGELGLMQIMPGVGAEYWERHNGRGAYDPSLLLAPEHNIDVGCWYLRDSFDLYRGSADPLICGLARYNAGQTRVARWITAADVHPKATILESIDFPSTREYVLRVVERARRRSQNYLW